MKKMSWMLCLLMVFVWTAGCETKTKAMDRCGDGFVDPGEDCDGSELNDQTCGTLGYYNPTGRLACASDCSWDTTDCGGHCGDGLIENAAGEECEGGNLNGASCGSLNYTNGGVLACDATCRYDVSDCRTNCGNGNVEPGEGCDDDNRDNGDGCSDFCQVEYGWICDDASPSVCTRTCWPGETACGQECLDLFNDPQHCGTCENVCDAGALCIGGACLSPHESWSDAGSFGLGTMWTSAMRHDLAPCVGGPLLYVQSDGEPPSHRVFQLNVSAGQWSFVTPPPLTLAEDDQLDPGMAAACLGAQMVVGYSVTNFEPEAMELVIRRLDAGTMTWLSFGSAGLTSECGTTTSMDLQSDALGQLHVLTAGSWLCPDAVDYAWWDGIQWQAHPSNTTDPRQLTHFAMGRPAMAPWRFADGRMAFGIARSTGEDPDLVTEHRVLQWLGTDWGVYSVLDENPQHEGWGEDLSMVSAEGFFSLCVAWTENVSGDPVIQEHDLFVRCYDGLSESFHPSAPGEARVDADHRAKSPSLAVIGRTLYIAYLAREIGVPEAPWQVRVMRRSYDATAWDPVGSGFEDEVTSNAHNPQLMVQDGRVFLSFVEQTQSAGPRVHIKRP